LNAFVERYCVRLNSIRCSSGVLDYLYLQSLCQQAVGLKHVDSNYLRLASSCLFWSTALSKAGVVSHTTVDEDRCTCDIRRNVRSESDDHSSDLIGMADAVERDFGKQVFRLRGVSPNRLKICTTLRNSTNPRRQVQFCSVAARTVNLRPENSIDKITVGRESVKRTAMRSDSGMWPPKLLVWPGISNAPRVLLRSLLNIHLTPRYLAAVFSRLSIHRSIDLRLRRIPIPQLLTAH